MELTLFTDDSATSRHFGTSAHTFIGNKLPLAEVQPVLARIEQLLKPHCSQIAVAGSVRRGKPLVKDIEFVAIEKHPASIIHELHQYCYRNRLHPAGFFQAVGARQIKFQINTTIAGEPRIVPFEIFISQPEYYGYTYLLRTGHLDWNKAWMCYLKDHMNCKIKDNTILRDGKYYQFATEQELFDFIGIAPVEPQDRLDHRAFRSALHKAGLYNPFTGYKARS